MATRIYADFNGLVRGVVDESRTAVVLDTFGSLRDLANNGLILSPGLPLIAVDESDENEDLEGHGTAQYDFVRNRWIVEFDEQGVRYVPRSDKDSSMSFKCVSCGTEFPQHHAGAMILGEIDCSACGTSALAPYQQPAT